MKIPLMLMAWSKSSGYSAEQWFRFNFDHYSLQDFRDLVDYTYRTGFSKLAVDFYRKWYEAKAAQSRKNDLLDMWIES